MTMGENPATNIAADADACVRSKEFQFGNKFVCPVPGRAKGAFFRNKENETDEEQVE